MIDVLMESTLGKILVYIIAIFSMWQFIDMVLIMPYNAIRGSGPNGCANKDNWIPLPLGLFSGWILKDDCPEISKSKYTKDKGCGSLGRFSDYAEKDKTVICGEGANKLFNDAVSNNVVAGYNATEVLSYVIVPTLTCLGIAYGLLFTRKGYAEWIFWILIATLIYSGLTTLSYDTDIAILPPEQSPLSYITNKLGFSAADELKYSFMARKADGKECLVEGVMLGGGVHSSTEPPTYTGNIPKCSAKELPFE